MDRGREKGIKVSYEVKREGFEDVMRILGYGVNWDEEGV